MFFKIFIERRTKQIERSFIQLNVVKLKVCKFDCVVYSKNVKIFNIILREIEVFLNLIKILSKSRLDFAQILNLLNLSKLSLFYKNIKINTYN